MRLLFFNGFVNMFRLQVLLNRLYSGVLQFVYLDGEEWKLVFNIINSLAHSLLLLFILLKRLLQVLQALFLLHTLQLFHLILKPFLCILQQICHVLREVCVLLCLLAVEVWRMIYRLIRLLLIHLLATAIFFILFSLFFF